MTQITRKSVPMRGLILLLTVTLGAGLVLSGCGDDDTATTPAPAPPPPPPPAPEPEPEPPPAPEAPATPTGFHVDTTQTSLTWHWNAVEGAIGYAVQVSTDEMFDAEDAITPTAETSFTVADLPPQTTLYGRVAAAAGTLEAPILSAWTTHVTGTTDMPPPPPPPPMAPATPTGLMAEGDEGSITWMWDAVEGADGYAIQVSMDEMFDDMDETTYTMETMHTVSDLGYGETRFARVASTSGEGEAMLKSMYTTHVTGMSMAEPPPPPPPALMVSFTVPEGENPLEADDETDEEAAMATMNGMITLESNHYPVAITPDLDGDGEFGDDAGGVALQADDEMDLPFSSFDAEIGQKMVVEDGVTFMLQRMTFGANQEMEPDGDVAYVTCGPFRCQEGMEAPEVTIDDSAECTAWDPTLELQVGLIDNSLSEHTGIAYVAAADPDPAVIEVTVFDGLDLGWHYTSSLDVNITHDLSVTSDEAKGVKAKSSATSLGMSSVGRITLGRTTADENDQVYYALSAEPDETTGATVNVDTTDVFNPGSCQPRQHQTLWGYNDNVVSRISQPDDCFRLTVDHGLERNYLDPYTLTMDPQGGDVSWGKIDWWEDDEDLQCPSMSWQATVDGDNPADGAVDVCAMFEDEVARLPTPTAVAVATTEAEVTGASNLTEESLAGFNLNFKDAGASRHRFTAMWYNRPLPNGKNQSPPPNLYAAVVDDGTTADVDETHTADRASGYNATVFVPTLDDDHDPIYGDLGKVTIDGLDKPDNFAANDDSYTCTADDGGSKATGTAADPDAHANSTLCDAKDVEIETSVTFPLGLGYGCDAVTVDYTLTCQWSSRGNIRNTIIHTPAHISQDDTNPITRFVTCKVE